MSSPMIESSTCLSKPTPNEYHEYYRGYIEQIPDDQCLALLESQVEELRDFFSSVVEEDASIVHVPYTWTIKQVVGHLIDVERIFADRLHRFSSGETQPQPGMDQDAYIANQDFDSPTLKSLIDELIFCRQANLLMVRRIRPDAWNRRGIASSCLVSTRALVWMLVGHFNHHLAIIRKRLVYHPR